MNENIQPELLDFKTLQLMDPSRTLISPPPEEELQRNVFGFPRNTQPKRKRNGPGNTPSKEQTPNPKPRKAHRRQSSMQREATPQESPTRPSHARNPSADYLPGPSRRSVTPYEPPPDVFTPPREVVRHQTPVPQKARPRQRTTTPQPRATTPLRVVVQTSVKKEMPTIDLSRRADPPSPTDDPLLLLPSSSPVKSRGRRSLDEDDSSDLPPIFDWTLGPTMDVTDIPTSDSMDLDHPESFDGPAPLSGPVPSGWDSDSDEDEVAELPTIAPLPRQQPPRQSASPGARTSLSLANFLPVRSPSRSQTPPPHARFSTSPTQDPVTPPAANVTETFSIVSKPTKLDPPTPGTKARADAWGIWGSPYPGRGADGDGSFRMDGSFRRGKLLGELGGPLGEQTQAAESIDQEDEEMVEEGVSFLRDLREEDAAAARRNAMEEEDDDEEEEEEEVRQMSVEPEADEDEEPTSHIIAPSPRSPFDFGNTSAYPAPSPFDFAGAPPLVRSPFDFTTPPSRVVKTSVTTASIPFPTQPSASTTQTQAREAEADTSVSSSASSSSSNADPGPSVYRGRGQRPSLGLGYVDAGREIDSLLSGQQATEMDEGEGDDDAEESDEDLLGLVKITSSDPRAAARAAAILKQHDYDCFTRLQDKKKRRHSYGGVTKASASSPARPRSSKVQDLTQLQAKADKAWKERKLRRQSARVVGERVYFPGSPKPVTTAELLAEAEKEVSVSVAMPASASPGESISTRGAVPLSTPVPKARSGRRSSLAREVPLPDSDEEQVDDAGAREWTKADWKALDACFTDERIAVAERLGMVLNLSVAPAAAPSTTSFASAFMTPQKRPQAEENVVMMASADAVELGAVVKRFEERKGGRKEMKGWGDSWDEETLTQRVRALQNKQRAGNVAPPTPRAATTSRKETTANEEDAIFSRRLPTMEVPDFTPLGKRAMPPRPSRQVPLPARPQFPDPVKNGPFSNLPPTPEPLRKRRVPGSLLAPRYSHLLEEARAVAREPEPELEEEEEQETSFASNTEEEEEGDSSFVSSSAGDVDAEMLPATPLREREAVLQEQQQRRPQAPATIGNRVKGFLFSYLPTMAKTAPGPARTLVDNRPRLPLPPLDILQKPRGPVTTPARPPLPRSTAPKELVTLQPAPAPPPKTMIPRKIAPKRLAELKHVSPPPEQPVVRVGPRPRTSSGGSVKDLVKNFEALERVKPPVVEVKRVKSVGELKGVVGGKRPWR